MNTSIPRLLSTFGRYAASNPKLFADIARHGLSKKLAIPIDLIQWALSLIPEGPQVPGDMVCHATPPALAFGGTFDLMGTQLRVDMDILFESLDATNESVKVAFRVQNLRASVLNNLDGNLAKLLASGALNLAKPASLLSFIPKPEFIIESKDDYFVIELMAFKGLAENEAFKRALAALTPLFSTGDIYTNSKFLLVGLQAHPSGLKDAIRAFR